MQPVEFSGIPGSGKSTILPIVARHLKNCGRDVVDRQNLIHRTDVFPFNSWFFQGLIRAFPKGLRDACTTGLNNYFYLNYEYQLRYMPNHLPLLRHVMGVIDKRPIPLTHKGMLIRWFIKMAGSYQMASDCLRDGSVFLCDEGYVQKVVSLYISVEEEAPDPAEIERYLDQIPDGLTLIHVTAEPATCKQRLAMRKLPRRLEGRGETEIEAYLRKSREAIDFAADHVSRKGGRVVVIDNSREPFTERHIERQLSQSLNLNGS